MGLYRRSPSKVWYVDITKPDGKRHRESSNTENKQLAKEFHDKLKVELWRESQLGIQRDKTFGEAVEAFLNEKRKRGLKAFDDVEDQLGWWVKKFGKNTLLKNVTQERIVELIEEKMQEGVKASTCNKYLARLKTCLRLMAIKYKWLDMNRLPYFFMYPEPKGRVRWLTPAEITRLLDACPNHIRPMVIFALSTGLRRANVVGLRWEQVDMERQCVHISGDEMKAGADLSIPLSQEAMEVVRQQIGKSRTHVFTYRSKPIKSVNPVTWDKITKDAGLEDFRWHDLRHCWATMMVRGGVPLHVIQALGAWKSERMVLRYGHQSTDSLKPYTEVVSGVLRGVTSQFTSHPPSEDHPAPRLRVV